MIGVSSTLCLQNTFLPIQKMVFFAVNTGPERNATFVQCAVLSEKAGTLHVNISA